MKTRVIIPDSHGNHIDPDAAKAFLADLKVIDPDEVIFLGDHLDAGGTFNSHQRTYTNEFTESYEDDVNAANDFIDAVQRNAPRAAGATHYIEGNHEQHVERWAARNFHSHRDAEIAPIQRGESVGVAAPAYEVRSGAHAVDVPKCRKHPKYKVMRAPTADCEPCRVMWANREPTPRDEARAVEAEVARRTKRAAAEAVRTAAVLAQSKRPARPSKADCAKALRKAGGVQLRAAKAMGVSLSNFRYWLGLTS